MAIEVIIKKNPIVCWSYSQLNWLYTHISCTRLNKKKFKVDTLQIIVVGKKYIYVSQLFTVSWITCSCSLLRSSLPELFTQVLKKLISELSSLLVLALQDSIPTGAGQAPRVISPFAVKIRRLLRRLFSTKRNYQVIHQVTLMTDLNINQLKQLLFIIDSKTISRKLSTYTRILFQWQVPQVSQAQLPYG